MTNLVKNEDRKTLSKLAVTCLVVLSRHLPEQAEESHKHCGRCRPTVDRDVKAGPPEYDEGYSYLTGRCDFITAMLDVSCDR